MTAVRAGDTRRLLGPPGPQVDLLDARRTGLDEPELRVWTRAVTARSAETHVSRSYAYPYALVACHGEPVGVDIEPVQPVPTGFLASILTPSERMELGAGDGLDHDARSVSLWSAKEALAKALGDALRYDPRRLESPAAWPAGRCGRWRAMPLNGMDGHVGWVCWAVAGPVEDGG